MVENEDLDDRLQPPKPGLGGAVLKRAHSRLHSSITEVEAKAPIDDLDVIAARILGCDVGVGLQRAHRHRKECEDDGIRW